MESGLSVTFMRQMLESCVKRTGGGQATGGDWKPSTRGRHTADLSHCLRGSWSGRGDRPKPLCAASLLTLRAMQHDWGKLMTESGTPVVPFASPLEALRTIPTFVA